MSGYLLTPDAQTDLISIRQHTVEQWGLDQSQKYLSELRRTLQLLAKTPDLGRIRQEIGNNVLSFPHASHVIYYIKHQDKLVVFGILHKRMVPLNHLANREIF